ncbi:hypothetical protein RR48_00754 [Papilio machaon]|uniref:Uncharacterized protein n=1 Tax=Papilio machaon TaxID=76193 RepID=A0A0N1IHP0_PAPMA|nr:hypothetical protein RR48_00754 [Papilio machaon]
MDNRHQDLANLMCVSCIIQANDRLVHMTMRYSGINNIPMPPATYVSQKDQQPPPTFKTPISLLEP